MRNEQRKAETRQKLITAAQQCIAEMGYVQVDILDITERANVSRATFYKHFRNKEDCVQALMQQGFDSLLAEIMSTRHHIQDHDWAAKALARVYGWAEDNRELMNVMTGGSASPALNAFGRRYMAEVVEQTLSAQFADSFLSASEIPVAISAQVITGIVIQLTEWWLSHSADYTAEQLGRMTRDIITSGLGQSLRNLDWNKSS
ncbi:MAG: TetR/AcrR family transcriptional regulator C-terminal domain-containing protein [Anaerolineae bacterium]